MKVTQLKEKNNAIALSTINLDKLVEKIKTETQLRPVSNFREQMNNALPPNACPKCCPPPSFTVTTVEKA